MADLRDIFPQSPRLTVREDPSWSWIVGGLVAVTAALVWGVLVLQSPTVIERRAAFVQSENFVANAGEVAALFEASDLPVPSDARVLSLTVYDDLPGLPLEAFSYLAPDSSLEKLETAYRAWAEAHGAELIASASSGNFVLQVRDEVSGKPLLFATFVSLGEEAGSWIVSLSVPRPS